jgi:chorismate synthase|tara:strand:- start:3984 stop:5072 length:1089 start_codon:yes stop_codon:yes gene_type:complete
MSDSLGKLFKITNFGESHGKAIGVVIEGCPPLLEISEKDIQIDLNRRAPGQSEITTERKEEDKVEILSGVFNGKTTGAPIALVIFNKDYKKEDYKNLAKAFRPSHSDFTWKSKYGIRDPFGGGRTSARLTAGNVAAGAIAKKILKEKFKTEITAYVKKIKGIESNVNPETISKKTVESNIVRCPDKKAAKEMIDLIKKTKEQGDSLGGVIECITKNVPVGLGEPIFDKLDADLAKAVLSINATKGFEIGSGFKGTKMYGSQHNDPFIIKGGKVKTKTNNSGGIQGGISDGMPIIFKVAFKPTSTIGKAQKTVSTSLKQVELKAKGRHDPCVLPRAVPIVEAMTALVLCDHYLRHRAQCGDIK